MIQSQIAVLSVSVQVFPTPVKSLSTVVTAAQLPSLAKVDRPLSSASNPFGHWGAVAEAFSCEQLSPTYSRAPVPVVARDVSLLREAEAIVTRMRIFVPHSQRAWSR